MNRKFKISIYLAIIFVAGVMTGVFISYQIARHLMPSREKMADHWSQELEAKLQLSADQTARIRPIIERTMVEFSRSLSEQMRWSLSNCNAQVAVELTPAQRDSLEQLQQEKEAFIRTQIGGEKPGAK
jgi:hypothetical protein